MLRVGGLESSRRKDKEMAEEISKTRSFLLLGGVLLADIFNNFIAFRYKELLPCSLPVFIAISHICFFIFHKCLSTYFHPPSVALATSPVPPELHVPSSWQGRLGRSLMLWFEFLTDKLGVLLLCLHLGFILHLFFLSPAEGRKELALLDPKLGRPLPEKDYGNRCNDLTQVYDSFYDFFVFVHFSGFMLMAGCMRNFAVPFIIGVFDEFLELSLQHIFPNFRECWWDHVLADVFGANLLGCLVGYLITHVTEIQPFTWLSPNPVPPNEPAPMPRLRFFPSPFLPSIREFLLGSDKRSLFFLTTLFLHRIACFVIPFAFKYVMWVPVPHIIFIWYGICQFGLQLRFYAELYQHLASARADEGKDPRPNRVKNSDMGIWRYQWRIANFLALGLEVVLIAKTLYLDYSNLTPPPEIMSLWILLLGILAFCFNYSLGKPAPPPRQKRKHP